MAAEQDIIRVHEEEQAVTFQVEGRATMPQSLPLRRHAELCCTTRRRAVRIDLRHCTYMDSTFLGTLLCLKRAADRQGRDQFALVAPSPACCRLLEQMGLTDVLPVVTEEEPAGPWTNLPGLQDGSGCRGNVVQAHQELATLPGPAGETFRAVVRCLETETALERREGHG